MATIDFNLKPTPKTLFKWLFLKLLSVIYSALIHCWLLFYQLGLKKPFATKKMVISVGNITVGGTGKTPMISWLLCFCRKKKLTPAVLTRGYKANKAKALQILNAKTAKTGNSYNFGDEPWMLFQQHPETTFYIGTNRVQSAQKAEIESDLLLLDDGMQHLRLDRKLNLVLIDCLSGIGNGNLLPLGPLREPLKSLNRADAVIYTRANTASPSDLQEEIEKYLPPAVPTFNARLIPRKLVSSLNAERKDVSELSEKQVILFSGIGNPASFTKTIEQQGAIVKNHLAFTDHVSYDDVILDQLIQTIDSQSADLVICTEKDWVKLDTVKERLREFWYLKVEMEMDRKFEEFLANQLRKYHLV